MYGVPKQTNFIGPLGPAEDLAQMYGVSVAATDDQIAEFVEAEKVRHPADLHLCDEQDVIWEMLPVINNCNVRIISSAIRRIGRQSKGTRKH